MYNRDIKKRAAGVSLLTDLITACGANVGAVIFYYS